MGGMFIPPPTTSEAPQVEDGLAIARFDGLEERVVEQFKTASDKYGKPDDGRRLDLNFTLVDEKHVPIYEEGAEDPISLRQEKAIKPGARGKNSNFYEYLQGLLTKQEFALWEASTEDAPYPGPDPTGRVYNVQIGHNQKGWPHISTIIGIAKAPK